MKKISKLDAELGAYKGRYGVNYQYFCDLLGKDGKPLYKDSLIAKRKGTKEFTVREAKVLADILRMSLDELYEILPDINH